MKSLVEISKSHVKSTEEEILKLLAVVNKMPTRYFEVMHLFINENMTYEQIAENLNIAIGTVRSRLNRARSYLARVDANLPTKGHTSAKNNYHVSQQT